MNIKNKLSSHLYWRMLTSVERKTVVFDVDHGEPVIQIDVQRRLEI